MAKLIVISRHQEGISINPKEFVLDKDNGLMTFETHEEAKQLLLNAGYREDDIGENVFIEELEED